MRATFDYFKAHLNDLRANTAQCLMELQRKEEAKAERRPAGTELKYSYPEAIKDRLFEPEYFHKHRFPGDCVCDEGPDLICDDARHSSCEYMRCDKSRLVKRKSLKNKQDMNVDEAQKPRIHFGRFASGDMVMKSASKRDETSKQEQVIAFEMRGAGVGVHIPRMIIKSVCDYADGHKNKSWQDFAAPMAAAATKALLERYTKTSRPIAEDESEQIPSVSMANMNIQPMYQSYGYQGPMLEARPYYEYPQWQ